MCMETKYLVFDVDEDKIHHITIIAWIQRILRKCQTMLVDVTWRWKLKVQVNRQSESNESHQEGS